MSPRRALSATIALGVALVLSAVAPADWDDGPAVVEVTYLGDVVLEVPIVLGSTETLGAESSGSLRVSATGPAPSSARPIEVDVEVDDPSRSPELGDVEVALLVDGRRELVPVLDAGDGTFRASRRPPVGADVVLAVLGAAVVLWVSEVVPLFVTSLAIPVAFAATSLGTAAEVLAPFFDPIIVLFFGGFLMAEGMKRARLDHLVAITIVDRAGGSAARLYLTLIFLAAFLSMWMSNTAAVTVLIPIAMAVTEPLESPSYRKAVVLGVAYAATIGGVGSAIGTPANPLAITFVERLTGREISFAEWFAFGLPMVVIFLPVMAVYLWLISGVDVRGERMAGAVGAARTERLAAGPLDGHQLQVIVVFGAVMALWLSQSWHGLNTGIVALAGALALFVLGRTEPEDLGRISWSTLLTFGGGLTIGTFMVTSGTSDWLITRLGGLGGWPAIAAIAVTALAALVLTTVASNTAAAATLIPLAIPLAGIIGIEPVLLVVVVAIASSVDFALVIGTPPTMLAYDTGQFTASEILRKGAVLDLIGIAVLVVLVVPVWRVLGLL